jgi:uncharacterized membrane protein YcaP (DUF421 family)
MPFDLQRIFADKFDLVFAGEILLRTFIMFLFVLVFLRMSGKKGIRQLSVFEVAIIISLGSAAGDPMFQSDVPVLPALLVFAVILALYRLITWLMTKSQRMETLLEGNAEYIIEDGQFVLETKSKHTFARDEFFSEMRKQNVEHLGQVRIAILETTGNMSFFYFTDDDVVPGLPILPKVYNKMSKDIEGPGEHACVNCGYVEKLTSAKPCARCEETLWVKAIKTLRMS